MQLVSECQQLPDLVEGVFHKCFIVLIQQVKENAYEGDRLEHVAPSFLAQGPQFVEPFEFAVSPRDFEDRHPRENGPHPNQEHVQSEPSFPGLERWSSEEISKASFRESDSNK